MQKIIVIILLILSFNLFGERFDVRGTVGAIRYHEAENTLAPGWQDHTWFSLKTDEILEIQESWLDSGYVFAVPKGNEAAIAILLTAQLLDREVLVTFDDAKMFPENQTNQAPVIQ